MWWLIALFSALFSLFFSHNVSAKKIYISLGEAEVKKGELAITPLKVVGASSQHHAVKAVFKTLKNDAELSNLFNVMPQKSFLENPSQAGVRIGSFKFQDWAPLGVEFLLKVSATIQGSKIVLQAYLYDVLQSKLISARKYNTTVKRARSAAHAVMDDILVELTGQAGVFQTKVVMLCKKKQGRKHISELFVMDMDGHNVQQITRDGMTKLFPSWSRDGKFITYTAFRRFGKRGAKQDLMIFNTKTGVSRVLFSKLGLNTGSSVWSPDNRDLLLSVSHEGTRAIYRLKMNPNGTAGGPLRRVIKSRGFDLEPDYSPDGKKIVFSSYRAGRPMIYTASAGGKKPVRLTWAGHYNSAPVWSPDGKTIVFQGQDKRFGFFDLFSMSPKGTNLERLTMHMGSNENASFSPDGRHIVHASNKTKKYQVYRMNIDGTGRRLLSRVKGYACMDPSWSPKFK